MRRLGLAAAAVVLVPLAAYAPATAHGDTHPANRTGTCWTLTEAFGSYCYNSGGHSRGVERMCFTPNDVRIEAQYYGHITFQFFYPHPAQLHVFYGGGPEWTVGWYDNHDQEKGLQVAWDIYGPKQSYPGENHYLYEVMVWCDGPEAVRPVMPPAPPGAHTVVVKR